MMLSAYQASAWQMLSIDRTTASAQKAGSLHDVLSFHASMLPVTKAPDFALPSQQILTIQI